MAQNRKTKKNKSNAKSWKSMFTFFRDMDPELKSILVKCAGGLVLLVLRPYKVGDFIEAQGFSGTVKEIFMDREKLTVEVQIFGRPTPVEVSFGQAEKQ